MRNPFAVNRLPATDRLWYERLRRIHLELKLGTHRRDTRTLKMAEAVVLADKQLTRAEAYDMHPDVLDVLADSPLPDGFVEASRRTLTWPLALVRMWFDRPLLVDSGVERLTAVVLCYLLDAGSDAKSTSFYTTLATEMAPTYATSAAMVTEACPDDIDPLDFVPYWVVVGADAEKMIRAGISLEYASSFASV